jgi:carboxylesterase type B
MYAHYLFLLAGLFAVAHSAGDTLVNTKAGPFQGFIADDVRVWKGIPYAKPPVGEMRWQYPAAKEPFTEVYDASFDAPGCTQTCALPPGNCPDYGTSEDCLYLTVVSPKEASSDPNGYPVFFWIHGGAFTQGLGNAPLYNGTTFAQKDVVNVVINYRLGMMGFLASKSMSGNYGLLDQRMALQWVQDNIGGFGGDASRVTIGGQSAGGMSVGSHLVMPGSKGLFSQTIMESNCLGMPYHTRKSAGNNADTAFKYLNCAEDDVACMKTKTPEEILDAQANSVKMDRKTLFINFLPFAPMVEEGGELPEQPLVAIANGDIAQVPIVAGTVLDEGQLFVYELFTKKMTKTAYHTTVDAIFGLHKAKTIKKMYPFDIVPGSKDGRDAFNILATDLIFRCPLRNVTRGLQNTLGVDAVPVYEYQMNHVLSFDCWGPDYAFCDGIVCHGSELPFVFNVFAGGNDADGNPVSYDPTADETQLAADMNGAWVNYIANGNPNKGAQTVPMDYPAYSQASGSKIVVLDEPGYAEGADERAEYCDMWDSMGYFY